MYNLYIFENDLHSIELIRSIFIEYQKIEGLMKDTLVKCVQDNFFEEVSKIKANPYKTNIYIIDITLDDDTNGLSLARSIREFDYKGYIIFFTSHLEWVTMSYSYNLKALNYIYKKDPNLKSQFISSLKQIYKETKVEEEASSPLEKPVFVFSNRKNSFKLPLEEIVYIETHPTKRGLIIHTCDDSYDYNGTIKKLLGLLPEEFRQCHKSFVVNVKNIKKIMFEKNTYVALLQGDKTCYISKKYYQDIAMGFSME